MTKLAIIHYMPLEYYPPVTNLLDTMGNANLSQIKSIKVFSCHNTKGRIPYRTHNTTNNIKEININRSPFPKATDNKLTRIFKYFHFNLFTLIGLILQQPNRLLYFESYSAWPAYIYSRFFNKRCRIFIHNHEYASKAWYATTMLQVRHYYNLEKIWLYPRAIWNSQTNRDRLKLFQQDNFFLSPETLKVMPNYPPKSWSFQLQPFTPKFNNEIKPSPLRIVYVGSLSFQNTYLKEFCCWVIQQCGSIQFDIYAYNLYSDVKEYLKNLGVPHIRYFEAGVEYQDIPMTISNYDVGIIFYKAYSENVINCVPNKFYEYHSCGLDVWFSDIMKSTHQHTTNSTYPIVVPVDFENLANFDWQKAVDKDGCTYKPSEFYCEEEYAKLISEITKA